MKLPAALLMVGLSVFGLAQDKKHDSPRENVKDGSFVHLIDGPASIFVRKDYVGTSGVWVAIEGSSPPAGPSVSEIDCTRGDLTCREKQANMISFGDGTFTLNADYVEYHVSRWNTEEIVAKNEPTGICRALSVIKFDLSHRRVYAYQTLSEPVSENVPKLGRDICNAAGSTWELHEDTPFSDMPESKTIVGVKTK